MLRFSFAFLFDAPDYPLQPFNISLKNTAYSYRSLAEFILKHAQDVDLLGDLFKNREDILSAFCGDFTQQASSPPLTDARASASEAQGSNPSTSSSNAPSQGANMAEPEPPSGAPPVRGH